MELTKVDISEYEAEGTFEIDGEQVTISVFPQQDGATMVVAIGIDSGMDVASEVYVPVLPMKEAVLAFMTEHDVFWVE